MIIDFIKRISEKTYNWLFRDLKNGPEECPTCGPTPDLSFCDGEDDDVSCEEVAEEAQKLINQYSKIWTNNANRAESKEPKDACEWTGDEPKRFLRNTWNRCKYIGEVRHSGLLTSVCLECQDCGSGDGSGGETETTKRTIGSGVSMPLSQIPRGECMVDGTCPESSCGYWHTIENARYERNTGDITVTGRQRRNRKRNSELRGLVSTPPGGNTPPTGTAPSDPCSPEKIYDETGCKVIGTRPVLLARGKMAYWESTEVYPLTKDCDGEYIYGEDAGKPIRHPKMPNRTLEPHFISKSEGVVSAMDPANDELANGYVRLIQIELVNVKLPEDTAKPLHETEPLIVTIQSRDDSNKSIKASGVFINTFKTSIHGEEFAVPKNGLNGPEYFDKNTYYGGNDTHRGGENIDTFSMVFHSPDTQFDTPPLNINNINLELNLFGKGWQYGHYAEGVEPDSIFKERENQKGVRSSIHLSNFHLPEKSINKCVQGIEPVPSNRIMDKGEDFTYPLLNLNRESSIYIEAKGNKIPLMGTTNRDADNNGHPGGDLSNDGTSDFSFLGFGLWHQHMIHNASAWYGNLKEYIPDQYGSIIDAVYYDFYPLTRAKIESGNGIRIENGDSFVNQHNLVRKAYISDKSMEDISPLIVGGGFGSRDPNDQTSGNLLGSLLRKLFESIGLEECNTCPEDGDPSDRRNGAIGSIDQHEALRGSRLTPWDGDPSTLPPATGKDIFYPHLLKTQIIYAVESDVNLKYRQTGSEKFGEVHYRNLKGLNLDSNFPENSKWEDGYLNRFFVKMNENSRFRMMVRVVANIIFTYVVGIVFIILGFLEIIKSLAVLVLGLVFSIGTAFSLAFSLLLIALGIVWIIVWVNSDKDNRAIDKWLGIDGCWPDTKKDRNRKHGSLDSRFMIDPGKATQFEDNYFKYNYDHSIGNVIEASLGLPDPYSERECEEEGYEVLVSNKQNPESVKDAYRNFKANSYFKVPSSRGKIQKMFELYGRIYIQTTDGLFNIRQVNSGGSSTIDGAYLDSDSMSRIPLERMGGTEEGRGGTQDPNACFVSKHGYISIDREAREIAIFNGQTYQAIGEFGMGKFLDNYIPYETIKDDDIVDEKTPNGVGFNMAIDNARNKLFITKNDRDRSWTLSFDLETNTWIGFEFFAPYLYAWDRFDFYSFNKNEYWRHNKRGEFSTVYGKSVPMVIDFVVAVDETMRDAFAFNNSEVDAEFDKWEDGGYITLMDEFFTEIGAYNSWQSSGLLGVVNNDKLSSMEKIQGNKNVLKVEPIHKKWRFSEIVDFSEDAEIKHMSNWEGEIFTNFTLDSFDRPNSKADGFTDRYLVFRFVWNGDKKTRVLLKNIRTEVQNQIL